ncbi:hypothetical protein [Thalassotalea agariperforans]
MNMSRYESRKRFAGIFWWSFCVFWILFIPLEPLIGGEAICFITGTLYLSIEKQVDKFMELGTYSNDVKWSYFFLRGLLTPLGLFLILTLSGEEKMFTLFTSYLMGFLISHTLYSLWKASKT